MKVRNYHIYGTDEFLNNLEEEYTLLGRSFKREETRLIIFALPRKKRKTASSKKRPKRR